MSDPSKTPIKTIAISWVLRALNLKIKSNQMSNVKCQMSNVRWQFNILLL
jgi:hypothetical protein